MKAPAKARKTDLPPESHESPCFLYGESRKCAVSLHLYNLLKMRLFSRVQPRLFRHTRVAVLVAVLLNTALLTACKKDSGTAGTADRPDMQQGLATIQAFFETYRTQKEHFSLDAAVGGVVTTRNGTRITLAPDALRRNGAPVSGPVNLWIHDVLYVSNMLLADKPTTTADGRMLECYGQIFAVAEQGGQALELMPDAAANGLFRVSFPLGVPQGQGSIPVWTGDTAQSTTTSGYNSDNGPATAGTPVALQRGVVWSQMPGAFADANTLSSTFSLDSLGVWRCAGAPYSDTRPRTTVLGYLGDKYNTRTGTAPVAYEPSMLFFKTRTTNTLVKYYQFFLNPDVNRGGFLSFQGGVPVGQEGTFLAISALGDKLYAESRDVAIAAPPSGKNYTGINFKLVEVTGPQLLAMIQQLNKK